MPTYIQLVGGNPASYATGRLAQLAAQLRTGTQSFGSTVDQVTSAAVWQGSTRDAATSAANMLKQRLDQLAAQIQQGEQILESAGTRLEALKVQLTAYVTAIEAMGWIITPVGVAMLGAPQDAEVAATEGAALPGLEAQALQMTAQIEKIVVQATEEDVTAAEALLDLSSALGGPGARPLSAHLREHLLHGEVKYKNGNVAKIVGYHSRPGGVDGSRHGIALDPATASAPDSHGLYTGRAVYNYTENGAARSKGKFSSFFPDTWSEQDTSRAVYGAFHSRRQVPGTDLWEGTYNGVRVQGYLKAGVPFARATADDIATAFPKA
jgi:hypothetical protein